MTPARRRRAPAALVLTAVAALAAAAAAAAPGGAAPIRVGAVFPMGGDTASLAGQELAGVDLAREMVNADGGVGGRRIELDRRAIVSAADAEGAAESLRRDGTEVVIGGYASTVSMALSSAAAQRGMVYWEGGAVVDQLTGRGLPTVFRVGATGSQLGGNSARFAVEQLAPRLGRPPAALTVLVVEVGDDYARSVADAAVAGARAAGVRLIGRRQYGLYDWPFGGFGPILDAVRAQRPDILVLASHIPDGVAFRRAMLAAGLHVGALIGSTMAECGPEFGAELDGDAVGVFASDRPGGGLRPETLGAQGRALYQRLAGAWRARGGGEPTEELLSGFSAAWTLFHEAMPRAAAAGGADRAAAVAAAARSLDLPEGSLPSGAGVRFSTEGATAGQNSRAAAVIWQWQGVRRSVVVWPPAYATGAVAMVPLPR